MTGKSKTTKDITNVLTVVTPEMAFSWLESTDNRRLRSSRVRRYANDMEDGNWHVHHQGIAFGTNGRLVDGQHRLHAILVCGKAIRLFVARGVPTSSLVSVDEHLLRNAEDVARFTGLIGAHPVWFKIARAMLLFDKRGNLAMSRVQTINLTEKHRAAICNAATVRFGSDTCSSGALRGITITPVMAVLARAYYHFESNNLAHAIRLLKDGTTMGRLHPGDRSMLTLRDWLMKTASGQGGTGQHREKYLKTERCLAGYADCEDLTKVYSAKREMFPLPEDQEPRDDA